MVISKERKNGESAYCRAWRSCVHPFGEEGRAIFQLTNPRENRTLPRFSQHPQQTADFAHMIKKTLYLQLCAAALAVCLAALFAGTRGAISAALAGVICILPAAWFVLRLSRKAKHSGSVSPFDFFIGEFVKVAATLGLLVIVVKVYAVHWPSLLLSMMIVLQASFLAFWKKS
jgi:ATP synthase protein I